MYRKWLESIPLFPLPRTLPRPWTTYPRRATAAAVQDRLAEWVSDLTTLHELTERLARTDTLNAALHEVLAAGATLVGAQRAMVVLEPADGQGPEMTLGLGLGHADLGHDRDDPARLRLVRPDPRRAPRGRRRGSRTSRHPDMRDEPDLDPRHREVAARLGYAASYAVPLATDRRAGWARPSGSTTSRPSPWSASATSSACTRATPPSTSPATSNSPAPARTSPTLREELLPTRLPRVPGVRLAVRHSTGSGGGGDWYDALPLPEGALGLAVGGVTGSGPGAVAAMGRLRASLRAYAVMEGEDPVAVLSDLELLLRLTEPARAATALFAYCEPAPRAQDRAGRGRALPAAGDRRAAHRVRGDVALRAAGHAVLLGGAQRGVDRARARRCSSTRDGLLHRTGEPMDRAFARLHAAAAGAAGPRARTRRRSSTTSCARCCPTAWTPRDGPEDVVLLAARFARTDRGSR